MRVQDAADRFHCRWLRTRRLGFARLLGRLSTLFLLAPMVLTYGLQALAEASGRGWFESYERTMPLLFAGLLGTVLFGVASALADRGASSGAVDLTVEEHDLVLHEGRRVRVIPRDRILGGIVLHERGETVVELHLRGDRVLRAGMFNRLRAGQLVEELEVGADRRRAAVTLGGQGTALIVSTISYPLAFLAMVSLLTSLARGWPDVLPIALLLMTVSTLLVRRALQPRQVVVGVDGVRVRAGLRDRFVRLDAIARVTSAGHDLVIELHPEAEPRRRGPLTVPCPYPGVAAGLADRIRAALELDQARARPVAVEALLDAGDQPLGAWRIAVGKALRGEGRYRSAPVTTEDLRAVLDDAAAPTRLRVGAAIALRDAGDPDAQARAGRAAEACADEGTRAALEAAAEDDLDARGVRRRLRA
jgi:hypothetical protein